ncbi:MAG: helix-turn-helix domain-containing protein [bacterium]
MDGSQVKEIRLSLELTQEEFAHRLGVTLCTVSRWETGKTTPSRLAKKQILRFVEQDCASDGK